MEAGGLPGGRGAGGGVRIVAAADLHYSDGARERLRALAEAMCTSGADVLVIAGDLVAGAGDNIREALALFDSYTGPKLMVAGNHDLWQIGQAADTSARYQHTLPEMAAEQGFHYLDSGPLVLGDTAFVGCMGWYDYSLRQRDEPIEGVRVTPVHVSPGPDGQARFRSVPGAAETSWGELTADDFRHKGLVWQDGGRPRAAVWNDALYVDWGHSDEEMTRLFADRLREQIAQVADEARRVVAVTHFVPFAELAPSPTADVKRAFAHAYLGSPLLGEALREGGNLSVVIFGHRHRQQVLEVDGIVCVDASIARAEERPLVMTLPD